MTHLALWLLPIAALACWRWSRLVAGALALAFGAWLVYRYAWQWDGLRWVSAVTGLAGVVEIGKRAGLRRVVPEELDHGARELWASGAATTYSLAHALMRDAWASRWAWGRVDVLALLLVGSAAADAAALLWWRRTCEWGPLPFFQTLVLLAMIAIGLWPRMA